MKLESAKMLHPVHLKQYYVFLVSPGDVVEERQAVRQFFERYNKHTAQLWAVRFEVVDWENYATIGVGRPQELITKQTLERFKDSLALVVGIMGQRFGSPTGKAESGTEEEFRWALQSNRETGFPDIKWFFKRVDNFISPPEPEAIAKLLAEWTRVRSFREEMKKADVFFAEYAEAANFREIFDNDLSHWLADRGRPWIPVQTSEIQGAFDIAPPRRYYENLERSFRRLDISGIDNDRAFEIPLSEIYVRLRVLFDDDSPQELDSLRETGPIDIQTALLRYEKLAIVGDPGSGKSTFLKYVALMLARSTLANNSSIAFEKLYLQAPLPIPVFVSCWDLSDFLNKEGTVDVLSMLRFIAGRLSAEGFILDEKDLEIVLDSGACCLMFDGLDEVPTDNGRAAVSRLLEHCVKRFPQNRYLVTSRVRAYTGDTILKGEFTRCDVQPFEANDRASFLQNWMGLLFKVAPDHVLIEATEANREFQSLISGIENNDRIRSLAVNPLLLTVIAIVHWNRKRLPEQRVELYDECVDVLLGQRKEAEHVQLVQKAGTFDEQREQQQREERSWVRKRFAEIALHIQKGANDREEASKADVLKMLVPRFIDQGASNHEQAEVRAAVFLERQELRSGLLVSRQEQNYRFVHLTFQEYLAAWYLSNQEFDNVVLQIGPHIRQQKWFETLELLGAEWAKKSDERLDSYLSWLLEKQGSSIADRAPVIALCANIVKDTSGIAELTPSTRKMFQKGVAGTLRAFRAGSGIPAYIQLQILEALGQLGAPVKTHLMDATKSGLFQVRRRAIEMLLPHLSDDELFGMVHILADRSKEPIKSFLLNLLRRDPSRTIDWLLTQKEFGEKATAAFAEVLVEFNRTLSDDLLTPVVRHLFSVGTSYSSWWSDSPWPSWPSRARLVPYLGDLNLVGIIASQDRQAGVRARALKELIKTQPTSEQTWTLVRKAATDDKDEKIRRKALEWLSAGRKDTVETWQFLRESFIRDMSSEVRVEALALLTKGQEVSETWQLVKEAATEDKHLSVRCKALELMAQGQKESSETWKLVREAAIRDEENPHVRCKALELLAEGQKESSETWKLVREVAMRGEEDLQVRLKALDLLLSARKDAPETLELLRDAATHDMNAEFRVRAFYLTAMLIFRDRKERLLLSRDLDALPPGLDASQPITLDRVQTVSSRLQMSQDIVKDLYERIADTLFHSKVGVQLSLEWQKPSRTP